MEDVSFVTETEALIKRQSDLTLQNECVSKQKTIKEEEIVKPTCILRITTDRFVLSFTFKSVGYSSDFQKAGEDDEEIFPYFFSDLSGSRKRIKTEMIGRNNPITNQVLNGLPIRRARLPEIIGNTVSADRNMDVRKSRPILQCKYNQSLRLRSGTTLRLPSASLRNRRSGTTLRLRCLRLRSGTGAETRSSRSVYNNLWPSVRAEK